MKPHVNNHCKKEVENNSIQATVWVEVITELVLVTVNLSICVTVQTYSINGIIVKHHEKEIKWGLSGV